jgi:hypothetical protein
MIGLNSGLLGVRRVPGTGSASGLWVPNEQVLARRANIWPSAPITDPNFAAVQLLLHGEGTNNGTVFTDSSSYARTLTPENVGGGTSTCVTSTAAFKYGSSSIFINGGTGYHGNYVKAPISTDWNLGNNDFTLEAWVYVTGRINSNGGETQGIIGANSDTSGTAAYGVYLSPGGAQGSLVFRWGTGFNTGTEYITTVAPYTLNTWYHVAVCRSGSNLRLFIDGQQVGNTLGGSTTYSITTAHYNPGSLQLAVGGRTDSWGFSHLLGSLDEVRVTKAARYTANFTPPTAAFPNA